MRALTLFFALAAVASGSEAEARQTQPALTDPTIIVVGRGEASRPPDYGEIQVGAFGEGDDQTPALAALEDARSRLVHGLQRLEGADVELLRTEDVRIERVFGPDCEFDDYNPQRSQGPCEPQGFVASMALHFRVAQANMTGQALSLAAQLGSTQVRAQGFGLLDQATLVDAAARAAFEDAQRQAELLARSSGGQLGRILRIQDGTSRSAMAIEGLVDSSGLVEGVVITGSRIRPAVQLTVTPEPVEATANLTVVFELTR